MLLEKASSLPAKERAVLRLLSTVYEDVATSTFLKCLKDCGIVDGNRQFTRDRLDSLLSSFAEAGLAERAGGRTRISRSVAEILTRELAAEGGLARAAMAFEAHLPKAARHSGFAGFRFRNHEHAMRCVRLALYRKDESGFVCFFPPALRQYGHVVGSPTALIRSVWWNPYDPEWLEGLPQSMRDRVLAELLADERSGGMARLPEAMLLIERLASEKGGDVSCDLMQRHASSLLETGRTGDLLRLATKRLPGLDGGGAFYGFLFEGIVRVLQCRDPEALDAFERALARKKKDYGKRKVWFETDLGAFYLLAILRLDDATRLREGKAYLAGLSRKRTHSLATLFLERVFDLRLGDRDGAASIKDYIHLVTDTRVTSLTSLINLLSLFWVTGELDALAALAIQATERRARERGLRWIAAEAAMLIERAGLEAGRDRVAEAEALYAETGTHPLVDVLRPQAPWEAALEAMTRFVEAPDSGGSKDSQAGSRLVWIFHYREHAERGSATLAIDPLEQKRTRKGWSKGRQVALKRLATARETMPFLTPEDIKVCEAIESSYEPSGYSRYYGSRTVYAFDMARALRALAGHPRLFLAESPDTPVELVEGQPELRVEEAKGELLIRMVPPIHEHTEIVARRDGPTRFTVFLPDEGHRRLLGMIGDEGLRVPASARERVLQAISAVASVVTVHSDIGGGAAAREVEPDDRLYAHVLPLGEGIRVELLVKPLGSVGPAHGPGDGGAGMVAEVEGERLQTRRDLDAERRTAGELLERCPVLSRGETGRWQWMLDDPAEALEALSELREAEELVEIDWPRGGKIQVSRSCSFESLSLRIERGRDWLGVSGDLRVDENRVVNLGKLLELLNGATGRFVRLEDGQYLALTEALRRRLDEFRAVGESSGDEMRLHPLMAARVDALAGDADVVEESAAWKRERETLREAYAMEVDVPSTLQAELREYQREGFAWMARLAHWGAGACLADDMGLGKTVQALALLVRRAEAGPAIVVAPTSVCGNWAEESARFAPALRVLPFAPSDRRALVENAGPFDLVICSYGLLQQEADLLAGREWSTAILDEAQTIKNAATRRSKAAMRLRAGFRAILTGTPIENHLGELWNLFRFANPGLLGSQERFQRVFAGPIERERDPEARAHLRGLLQPFLLRRTKAQVLRELPERTEITIRVEPGEEELAFYEALRRKCVDDVQAGGAAPEGSQFKILAAIMKLRRSCCHPALVQPGLATTSAKHEAFGEILDELLENRHKALVFSQFVDHLAILRERLDERGIAYQYLDGSTPQKERDKRVKAFQSGEGEVFLISLKAGGLGLNLTAADYVIHMDPWWNPAVEDQAADRAHRIGQTRPVTIYRIVTKGTIEEKIVELHRDKRDLADSLLEGAEGGTRLSAEDLLRLLREG
jgi:superfamily II DNA or RNA helicase